MILQRFEDGDTVSYKYDNSGALACVTDSAKGKDIMKSKKAHFWCIPFLLVLILGAGMVYKVFFARVKPVLIQAPAEITYTMNHPGNNRQSNATVWLGCYNNQLYCCSFGKNGGHKMNYYGSLCVFQGSNLVEVFPLSHGKGNITVLGFVDSYLYYRENTGGDYKRQKLYCYDLKSNEEALLYTGNLTLSSSLYFDNDGSVYFPLMPAYGEAAQFIHVSGQTVLGVEPLTNGYTLCENTYYVVQEYSDAQVERVLKSNSNDPPKLDEIPFEQAYRRWILPYEGGLLVHNERLSSLLYRIDKEGSVTNLFSIPCLGSESAVNIHGTDAYLSVLRYEKYGEYGMLRYENDTLEGTYRISLTDGSVEKINDMCFDGIYNFDDTCFYCSDQQGNVYKMEFDGTTNPVLLVS